MLAAAARTAPVRTVRAGAVDIATRACGDPAGPPVLLVNGAGDTMDWWHGDLVDALAAAGRHVIRYDTRDTGGSTTFPVGPPPYDGDDLLADALGVLDAYGVRAAHVVGVSMGGGLAQRMAVLCPERTLGVTLMSTSPGGPGAPGNTDLPPMSAPLARWFAAPGDGPDWGDRESVTGHLLALERAFAGTIPLDVPLLRDTAGRAWDRSPVPAAATNHWRLRCGVPVRGRLGEVAVPALVLHGTADPLIPYRHGEALASEIPGARLVPLRGMGHQMPPVEVWDVLVPALIRHTSGGR